MAQKRTLHLERPVSLTKIDMIDIDRLYFFYGVIPSGLIIIWPLYDYAVCGMVGCWVLFG